MLETKIKTKILEQKMLLVLLLLKKFIRVLGAAYQQLGLKAKC